MGVWEKPGQEDARMIAELRQLANGYDWQGNRVSQVVQMNAIAQYQQIQEAKNRQFLENARREDEAKMMAAQTEATRRDSETKAEVERRRVAVEEQRLRLEAAQAQERLRLESIQLTERLQIEKAEVLVKALQVAVNGGVDANSLLLAIQGLGDRLLTGSAVTNPTLQIEEKKK